jgi:murein DD-endopeptidase MepM/ murein hydrolase activator NlpD
MSRRKWLWVGLGSAGALLVFKHRRWSVLSSPIALSGNHHSLTPRGFFGAARGGPPAHAHQGIDLAALPGSYVYAVGDGVIVATDPGLGKIVRKLRLDVSGFWGLGPRHVASVVYADLGTPIVGPGDRVRKGDPIAFVNKTGFVHLAVKESRPDGEVFFDPWEAGLLYRLSGPEVA